MPKRAASSGISCPGCMLNFDTETHIPFIGSCGDSICAVCVNEKKILTCPECQLEGAFTWNQKNTVAMKFLAGTAKKKTKKSKKSNMNSEEMAYAPGEPVPAILDPKYRHFLPQVVNLLDPPSFVKLAATCKTLHNYCFTSEEVKITYDIYWIAFRYCKGRHLNYRLAETVKHSKPDAWYFSWKYGGYKHGFLSSADARTRLKNYPFAFRVADLRIETKADAEFFESLRTFLAEFPVKKIMKVSAWLIEDGHSFMQLLKVFHIKDLTLERHELPKNIREEFYQYFLQNVNSFKCGFLFPEQLLLKVSIPSLHLTATHISDNTLKQLIKKWADSTEDIDWMLYQNHSFNFDIDNIFEETLPFYHKGPVPAKRPIAFYKRNKFRKFYILRQDGKVVCTNYACEYELYISMRSPSEYPPCLLPHSDEPINETDSDESEDEPMSDEESESDSNAEQGE